MFLFTNIRTLIKSCRSLFIRYCHLRVLTIICINNIISAQSNCVVDACFVSLFIVVSIEMV